MNPKRVYGSDALVGIIVVRGVTVSDPNVRVHVVPEVVYLEAEGT